MPTNDPNASAERRAIIASAELLSKKVDQLSNQLTVSKRQSQQARSLTTRLAWVVVVLVIVLGVVGYELVKTKNNSDELQSQTTKNHDLVKCVQVWADAYTHRVDALTKLNTERSNALDELVRSLTLPQQQAKKVFPQRLVAYLHASDTYNLYIKHHPIPGSPKLNC